MPTFNATTTLTANQTIPNIMQGSQFEFPERPTRIQIYALVENGDAADMEVFFGQELQLARSPLQVGAIAGDGPKVPEDLVLDDICFGGRIVIGLTDTAGAACVVRTKVVLTPVA